MLWPVHHPSIIHQSCACAIINRDDARCVAVCVCDYVHARALWAVCVCMYVIVCVCGSDFCTDECCVLCVVRVCVVCSVWPVLCTMGCFCCLAFSTDHHADGPRCDFCDCTCKLTSATWFPVGTLQNFPTCNLQHVARAFSVRLVIETIFAAFDCQRHSPRCVYVCIVCP